MDTPERARHYLSAARDEVDGPNGGDVLMQCDNEFSVSQTNSWHSDPAAEERMLSSSESHRESRTYIECFPRKPNSPVRITFLLFAKPCEGRLLDLT